MIELSSQTYGAEEIAAIVRVLDSGHVTMGAEVRAFEEEFAAYIGVRHAVMCNSGSSANLLMVAALCATGALEPGNTVFAPALTWSTTVSPLIQHGLDVVLVDCDTRLQMCPTHLNSLAAKHPNAKAVIAAHILGNPFNVEAIKSVCRQHGLTLLEDSCETLGADYMGIKTGRFGEMASFSFYFSHHMTTMEGGMVVTDDNVLAEYLRAIRSHGWARAFNEATQRIAARSNPDIDPRFLFLCDGYNLRPTDVQATMGRIQLKRLGGMNERRQQVHARMADIVRPYTHIQAVEPTTGATPVWFAFPVLVRSNRNALSRHLESCGIQTRPIVAGNLARHPAFRNRVSAGSLPCADNVALRGLYWGLHPNVDEGGLESLEHALDSYCTARRETA